MNNGNTNAEEAHHTTHDYWAGQVLGEYPTNTISSTILSGKGSWNNWINALVVSHGNF